MIDWLMLGVVVSQFLIIIYLLRKCDEHSRCYPYILKEATDTAWKHKDSKWKLPHERPVPGYQILGREFRVDGEGNLIEVEKT